MTLNEGGLVPYTDGGSNFEMLQYDKAKKNEAFDIRPITCSVHTDWKAIRVTYLQALEEAFRLHPGKTKQCKPIAIGRVEK